MEAQLIMLTVLGLGLENNIAHQRRLHVFRRPGVSKIREVFWSLNPMPYAPQDYGSIP